MNVSTELLIVILLLAVVVIAAYFYLKRRQQHVHADPVAGSVEHRHEKSASEPIDDHGHDLDRPADAPDAVRRD